MEQPANSEAPEVARHRDDQPGTFLREVFDRFSSQIQLGRALDLACGQGRNTLYLAQSGFAVEAVDISEAALQEARQKVQAKGLTAHFVRMDLEHAGLAENGYDLVVNFNFLVRSLVPGIKRALKLGGHVIFDTYLVDQRVIGHPRNLNYLLGHNELLELFRDFRILYYREGKILERGREEYRAGLFGQRVV